MISDLGFMISDVKKAQGATGIASAAVCRSAGSLAEPVAHCVHAMSSSTNQKSEIRNQKSCNSLRRLTSDGSPNGISLLEVLIAMFIMLFGLMGVAAVFPVGSHYVVEGDKKDRSANLAQTAFQEIVARGILEPKIWLYATHTATGNPPKAQVATLYVDSSGTFTQLPPANSGNAFVIDALGSTATSVAGNNRWFFPVAANNGRNYWKTLKFPAVGLWPSSSPTTWPVRRMTLPRATPYPLDMDAAETIFLLRDDLAQEMPTSGDQPSIQRWAVDSSGNLLARQFKGNYSWMATVVPCSANALLGLQPSARLYDEYYEVSAAVFYKRDITPSASTSGSPGSERLIAGEFLSQGELVLYATTSAQDTQEVDTAVDGLKPGNWICVMGVRQTDGLFLMKWYKLLALDDETTNSIVLNNSTVSSPVAGRYAMVQGPDWPSTSVTDLRVAILPGVIDVYTRVMKLSVSN